METKQHKSNPISANTILIVIVVVSVILRLAAVVYLGNRVDNLPGINDQISYHTLAERLLGGYGFTFGEGWWPLTQAGAAWARNSRLSANSRTWLSNGKVKMPTERVPVPHYRLHPDTELEVIDVIRSKMSPDEWAMFCWGSALQYAFRMMDKGEPYKDADKAMTYLNWFKQGKP